LPPVSGKLNRRKGTRDLHKSAASAVSCMNDAACSGYRAYSRSSTTGDDDDDDDDDSSGDVDERKAGDVFLLPPRKREIFVTICVPNMLLSLFIEGLGWLLAVLIKWIWGTSNNRQKVAKFMIVHCAASYVSPTCIFIHAWFLTLNTASPLTHNPFNPGYLLPPAITIGDLPNLK
jgi:hypothetical protein